MIDKTTSDKTIRKNTKIYRVLQALTKRSYNRFEAARDLHDTALNSTISDIGNTYGIRVDRRTETVPGYQGNATHCCRYWISDDQKPQALQVLGQSS